LRHGAFRSDLSSLLCLLCSPKFTLRASRGLELPIHGDGLAVRSYLYVEDVADAYITVLLKGKVRAQGLPWLRASKQAADRSSFALQWRRVPQAEG